MLLKIGRIKSKNGNVTNWYNEIERNVLIKETIELVCLLCGKTKKVRLNNIRYGVSNGCNDCKSKKNHNKYEELKIGRFVKIKSKHDKNFGKIGKIIEIIKYKNLLIFDVNFTSNIKQLYFGIELEIANTDVKKKKIINSNKRDTHIIGKCPECNTYNLSIYINTINHFKLVCLKYDCDYMSEFSNKKLDSKIANHLIESVNELRIQKIKTMALAKLTDEEKKVLNLS